MAYIDTKHLGKCETCRHCRSGSCNTFCDCGEEYSPDMSKIPTADVVEVKHGEWKYYRKDDIAVCKNCSYEHNLGAYHQFATNYCPNCGAKMDGETE